MQVKKLVRSSSVSSAGKFLDRYFSGPYKSLSKNKARSLEKDSSKGSIALPPLARPNLKAEVGKPQRSRSHKSRDLEIESKIKKQIACLRAGSNKKKLQLETRGSLQLKKQQPRPLAINTAKDPVVVKSWKELKTVAPSTGYIYIDCQTEPKLPIPQQRTVTVSDKWVMITEPCDQSIFKIEEYTQILRKYESLSLITFFREFQKAKIFRKWKLVCETNFISNRKQQIAEDLKKAYREVYYDLESILVEIGRYKFIATSKAESITEMEFPDYLFNSSLDIIQRIHNSLFVACIQTCIRPIKEAVLYAQVRQEEKRKFKEDMKFQKEFILNYLQCENEILEYKIQQRFRKMRFHSNKSPLVQYSYVKSTAFITSFLSFFKVLKKCLFIINQAYIQWMQSIRSEITSKIKALLEAWLKHKHKFLSIMASMLKKKGQKYEFYAGQMGIHQVQLIMHPCQLDKDQKIRFKIDKNKLIKLYRQYAEYLKESLSYRKMLQCYAWQKYEIGYEDFKEKGLLHPEIQLLLEIIKTNDCYNSQQLMRQLQIENIFNDELTLLVTTNVVEVQEVIQQYNTFIFDIYDSLEVIQKAEIPSETSQYLQVTKSKLLYLPKTVNVGLFSLQFGGVQQYLLTEIEIMQTQIYINVPKDFKNLYEEIKERLGQSYRGMGRSLWTLDEILESYKTYENYDEYKLSGHLHNDINKLKAYLNVISLKCNEKYQESYIMYLQIKSLKDRIDIKSNIFEEKVPKRLVFLRDNVQELKEKVWKELFNEQAYLIGIGKEQINMPQKLQKIQACKHRLSIVKQNMSKLEEIGKMQQRYFIDQDLSVNTHSYEKTSKDINLLIGYINKFMAFKQKIKSIQCIPISNIKTQRYLSELLGFIKQINEDYLLLVSYEVTVKEILERYNQWKKYLLTIEQLCCLSVEDLEGVQLFKELKYANIIKEVTLADCIRININSIFNEIYHIKMTKLKKSELFAAFSDIEELQAEKPFVITGFKRIDTEVESKNKLSSASKVSSQRISIKKDKTIQANKVYEFGNIPKLVKSIEQTKNHIISLASSMYLDEYRLDIAVRIEQLDKILQILQNFTIIQREYLQVIQRKYFGIIQNDTLSHPAMKIMLINEESLKFFQKYATLKQQISEEWIKAICFLEKKNVRSLITLAQESKSFLEVIRIKINKLKGLVQELIQQISKDIPLLNLLDTATVLYIIQNPDYYFQLFYPIKDIEKTDTLVRIRTIHDELLEVQVKPLQQYKDQISQLNSLEHDIGSQLRKEISNNYSNAPIDNILNYMNSQIPLQVIYALDQIYLNNAYLSTDKPASMLLKNVDGQIKLICRSGIKDGFTGQKVHYSIALSTQLLESRLQLRMRIESSESQLSFRSILVIEMFEDTLCLKNLNTRITCAYALVDYTKLSFIFPFTDKTLVKICSKINVQQSLLVEQLQLIENIAARIMTVFFKVAITKPNVSKVLNACLDRFPIFVLGIVNNLKEELNWVYQEMNKIERIKIDGQFIPLDKRSRILPSLFIMSTSPPHQEISQTFKLRFRSIGLVYPCPKIVLTSKMLINDFLIDRGLFDKINFILASYIIKMRQRKVEVKFSTICAMCESILSKCKDFDGRNKGQDELLLLLFKDYYEALDVSFEKEYLSFIKGKNRGQFQRTTLYDLVQNVVKNPDKEAKIQQKLNLHFPSEGFMANFNYRFKQFVKRKLKCKPLNSHFQELLALTISCRNRPIAVIGPHQSGKSFLLAQYRQFLQQVIGESLSWHVLNVEILNELVGLLLTKKQLNQLFQLEEEDYRRVTWLVFQQFIPSRNDSLLEFIFQPEHEEHLDLATSTATISFAEYNSKKQKVAKSTHKLHSKYYCFELSSLKDVAPSYISMMAKIYLSSQTLDLQQTYELLVRDFLSKVPIREQPLSKETFKYFQGLFEYLRRMIEEVVNVKSKSFEWLVPVSAKAGLQRTLNYFFSFLGEVDPQFFESLLQIKQRQKKICKVLTYSLFATFQNFIHLDFHLQLQKVVRTHYSKFIEEEIKDRFFSKVISAQSKHLQFIQLETASLLYKQYSEASPYQDVVLTNEIKSFAIKYLAQLTKSRSQIIILGSQEAGKTTAVRFYLSKVNEKSFTVRATYDDQGLSQLASIIKFCLQKESSSVVKNGLRSYIVYIDDISNNEYLSHTQKYLLSMARYGCLVKNQQIQAAPAITGVLERRNLNNQSFRQRLWFNYIVSFQSDRKYHSSIFSEFIKGRIECFHGGRQKKSFKFQTLADQIDKSIKIVRFCNKNFKRSLQNWTYDFSLRTFKQMLGDLVLKCSCQKILTEKDFYLHLNLSVYLKTKSKLQSERQISELQTYIEGNIMDSQQFRSIKDDYNRQLMIFQNSIHRQKLINKKSLLSVMLTDNLLNFTADVQRAIKVSDCLLVNKLSVAPNLTAAATALDILDMNTKELAYCQSEQKFLNQIEKIIESSKKQSITVVYYLTLEEVLSNSELIRYIRNYIKNKQEDDEKQRGIYNPHSCKFLIEYSTHHTQLISQFLRNDIVHYSYVLYFKKEERFQPYQAASNLVRQSQEATLLEPNLLDALIKQFIRLFEDLRNFQPPKNIEAFHFHLKYLFSQQNFELFLKVLLENYSVLIKNCQNKKRMLQISLSQLGFMFKEYKELKKLNASLLKQEGDLRQVIATNHQLANILEKQFKTAQNEKIVQKIHKNDKQIQLLFRQIDQIHSSEKIWQKIYKNAQNAISRTEFAELKYMFLANYNSQKDLFELITFILGDNTDLASQKKCFSQINIISKIRETSIPQLPYAKLQQLKKRLQIVSKKDKLSCSRNIIEWANLGCRLGLHLAEKGQQIIKIEARIRQLNDNNKALKQRSNIEDLEKKIRDVYKLINTNNAALTLVQLKVKKNMEEAAEFEKQFDALIRFEAYCLEELGTLKRFINKIDSYCFMEAIQFTLINVLEGEAKVKMREFAIAKLRKICGTLVKEEQKQYFKLLHKSGDEKVEQPWLLKPKDYLSSEKKKLITEINKWLTHDEARLAVIDRRSVLSLDTDKKKCIQIKLEDLADISPQINFEKTNLVIITSQTWELSIKVSENYYEGLGKYTVLRHKHIRLAIPIHIPIIVVFHKWGPQEFAFNFKVIDLEFECRDFEETIEYLISHNKKEEDNQIQQCFDKRLLAEKSFLKIVYYLCKQTQQFNLKSKNLIKSLTIMIDDLNEQNNRIKHMLKAISYTQPKENRNQKLCKIISKLFSISLTYFPSQEQTTIYFRNILESSLQYLRMEGSKGDVLSIVAFVMEFLTQGLVNKFAFFYLYYVKIHAIEEGIATMIESQNLSFITNPNEDFEKNLRQVKTESSSLSKNIHYPSVELERAYVKILKSQAKEQMHINQLIQAQKLSFFNKLILKKLLIPKRFEMEVKSIVKKVEEEIVLKYISLLKKLQIQNGLFCVCDPSFWVHRLKFPKDYQFASFSEIISKLKSNKQFVMESKEVWVAFDDVDSLEQRQAVLRELSKAHKRRVSLIIFLKGFPTPQYQQVFKYIPFKRLITIFEIKQLVKVSHGQFSSLFKKINTLKNELVSMKPFNERIADTFLYEQLRGQISSNLEYTAQQVEMQIDWCYFQWDPVYLIVNKSLGRIISEIELNPGLLQELVVNRVLWRLEEVLRIPYKKQLSSSEAAKLEKQLRDEGLFLQAIPDIPHSELFKVNIYHREMKFKRTRINSYLKILRFVNDIFRGDIELKPSLVFSINSILDHFETAAFQNYVISFFKWKKMEPFKQQLNLSLIESQLTLFFLFEDVAYFYLQFSATDFPLEKGQPVEPQRYEDDGEKMKDINRSKSIDDSKNINAILEACNPMLLIPPRSNSRSSLIDRRLSNQLTVAGSPQRRNSSIIQLESMGSQEKLMRTVFWDYLYRVDKLIIGLRPLTQKQYKRTGKQAFRTLGLLDNAFFVTITDWSSIKQRTPVSKKIEFRQSIRTCQKIKLRLD